MKNLNIIRNSSIFVLILSAILLIFNFILLGNRGLRIAYDNLYTFGPSELFANSERNPPTCPNLFFSKKTLSPMEYDELFLRAYRFDKKKSVFFMPVQHNCIEHAYGKIALIYWKNKGDVLAIYTLLLVDPDIYGCHSFRHKEQTLLAIANTKNENSSWGFPGKSLYPEAYDNLKYLYELCGVLSDEQRYKLKKLMSENSYINTNVNSLPE